jgi:hypothetical protein
MFSKFTAYACSGLHIFENTLLPRWGEQSADVIWGKNMIRGREKRENVRKRTKGYRKGEKGN